jgi:glycosyltransferase 2 family protein
LKKILVMAAKISISVLIIGYLVWDSTRGPENRKALWTMLGQSKRWEMLGVAVAAAAAGTALTLVRWCYLVRGLGIPFPMRDSLRIGFLGAAFNLAPLGIVGGDLLKAMMLAHERPGNRAKALASVIVDRIVGLYVLFLVASAGVFIAGFWTLADPNVHRICQATLIVTAISTVGLAIVFVPGVLEGGLVQSLTRLPRVGRPIGSLIEALALYRCAGPLLLASCLMSVVVHAMFTLSLYFIARGLRFDQASFNQFWAVWPVSCIASTIPLPAGPLEFGVRFLYAQALLAVASGATWAAAKQQGLILALTTRLVTILVAAIGLIYYLRARREVSEVMHEAEEVEQAGGLGKIPAAS